MKCPYCNFRWAPVYNKCPNCNKILSLEEIYSSKVVSKRQMILIPLKGMLAFIVLYYILSTFTLPFSNELYLGLFVALFMMYKFNGYWLESNNISMNKFFPYFREFLILASIIIWLFAIVLKLVVDYIAVGKTIEFGFLGAFTLNYFIGFILGMLLMTFYYFNAVYKEQKKSSKLLEEANFQAKQS